MEHASEPIRFEVEDSVGVVLIDNPPVNALSGAVRSGLKTVLEKAWADVNTKAIVILCAGRTFVAGADIREFGKPRPGPRLKEYQYLFEEAKKPIVAAMHGTALGGGLELALLCHYRIALRETKLGLVEVKIGGLPGGGGTQRLPRLIGVERALEMITSGEQVDGTAALAMGLIDAIVESPLRSNAIKYARELVALQAPLKRIRDLTNQLDQARHSPMLFSDFRQRKKKEFRGLMAPEAIIRSVEAAVRGPFDLGLQRETELSQQLQRDGQGAALRHVFFAEREIWKVPNLDRSSGQQPILRVGVLGAGTRGRAIARALIEADIPVILSDVSEVALASAVSELDLPLRAAIKNESTRRSIADTEFARLLPSSTLKDFADCDLVIEAIPEDLSLKRALLRECEKICKARALLATSTSRLSVGDISAEVARPEAVIGLHFFSPVHATRLVEVVRGQKTSLETLSRTLSLIKRLGKIGVTTTDTPGFIGLRMLEVAQRAVNTLVLEGSTPWVIDRVLYDFGFPMGPFAMLDAAGLDLTWNPQRSVDATLQDLLCKVGRLGRKASAGYYDYDHDNRPIPSATVERIILEFSKAKGFVRQTIADSDILDRCLYPLINEGAKVLGENVALRASDIDVVWIHGLGFPAYRGGPMFYANKIGLGSILARLRDFEKKYGTEFEPAPLLVALSEKDAQF